MATYFAKSSVTISPVLIEHVERLYSMAKNVIVQGGGLQSEAAGPDSKEPHPTDLAVPAYILAVAAVEAFVNEIFLSPFGRTALGPLPNGVVAESLENLDLPTKLLKVPSAVLGRSLDPAKQPHQDMKLLTQLRNELIHYKMGDKPPKPVNVLAQRGIASQVPPEQEAGGPQPWADRVNTLEGIRWAYNTACKTALALLDLIADEKRSPLEFLRQNFHQIR